MDKIRLANPAEVEAIRATSDLTAASMVLKMGDDHAVIRPVIEVDPLITPTLRRRLEFIHGIETHLRLTGHREYYFTCDAADEPWHKVLEHYGAQKTTTTPQYRFKVSL